jgi:hypothetical protein
MGRDAQGAYDRLLEEIASEKAAALRRIAASLEETLVALRLLKAEIDAGMGERAAKVAAFNAKREDARLYRWYLVVQREAIGLRRHEALDEFYSVPAPIRD